MEAKQQQRYTEVNSLKGVRVKMLDIADYPPLLTPKQTAELLQVSEGQVREWARTRQITSMKVGRLVRIPKASILARIQTVVEADPRTAELERHLRQAKRKKAVR